VCESILFATHFLHAIIAVPEGHFKLITCYTFVVVVVVVMMVIMVVVVSPNSLSAKPFNLLQIQTKHLHLLDQLNNSKEHGQLNYVLQTNSEGFTPNIPAIESDQDPLPH
jgi:hypothetical protein